MATGDILSCEVLSTGWQARVVIEGFKDGGAYNFGDISTSVLNASFRITVTSEGFDTTGTPANKVRYVYADRVVQQAYPNQAVVNETETGGNVELIVSLSDYVYDDDRAGGAGTSGVNPTLTVTNDFYLDNGAGGTGAYNNPVVGLAVTNSSTQDYPKVAGMRWATVPYQRFTGSFDVELVAFHRHAENGKPLACMKFNDGTTDTYVTSMSKSAQADSLPCYVKTLTATDYGSNVDITINATAYPWVGDADSVVTSVGGTVNALTLGPLQLRADKNGVTPIYYAVVDTAGNDTTGVASTTYATAAASPFATIRKAVDALSTANGGKADFCVVLLNAGSHSTLGSTGNGSCTAGWVTISPNSNTGATKATAKITGAPGAYVRGWTKYQSITFEPTGYVLGGAAGRYLWLDDCAVNRATYSTTQPFGEYPHIYVTHCTSDKVNAFGANGANNVPALVRGTTATDSIGFTGAGFGPRALLTTTVNGLDTRAVVLCDISASNTVVAYSRALGDANTGNSTIGGSGAFDDIAIVCNVVERSAGTQVAVSLWSDGNVNSNQNIILWHNTVAGERTNVGYNEGATAASRKLYSIKYNALKEFDTKHDVFKLDGTRTAGWSVTYGVGSVGNHAETTLFPPYFFGIRSTAGSAAGYTSDRSQYGTGAGGGDYTPAAGSPLLNKIATAADVVIPWDINGVAYAAGGCAGAITVNASVTGTIGAVAPTATASVSGAPVVTGTAGATAPTPTAAAAGSAPVIGTASAQAAAATGAASGTPMVTGSAGAAAAPGTGAVTGAPVVTGSAAAQAPAATASASNSQDVTGTVSATAPNATASASGAPAVAGSAQAQAPVPAASAAGTPIAAASVAAQAPPPTAAAAGTPVGTGTGSAQVPAPTGSATGTPVVTGAGAATAPAATVQASDDAPPTYDVIVAAAVRTSRTGVAGVRSGY